MEKEKMALLRDFVKANLRITTNAFDSVEIDHLINACIQDFQEATGASFDIDNPVMKNLVAIYVRANFGEGNDKCWALYQDRLKALGVRFNGGHN